MDRNEKLTFLNGRLLEEHKSLEFSNRAFALGESVFTSALIKDGSLGFAKAHEERLISSYQWLYNEDYPFEGLEKSLKELVEKHNLKFSGNLKLRVTLFKDHIDQAQRLIQLQKLTTHLNDSRLKTFKAPLLREACDVHAKIGSYAHVMRAKRICESEPLFYDIQESILECAVANIILVKLENNEPHFIEPDSHFHIFKGITLTEGLRGLEISARSIKKSQLHEYQAAFLLNNLNGAVKVDSIDDKVFDDGPFIESCHKILSETIDSNFKKTQSILWQ